MGFIPLALSAAGTAAQLLRRQKRPNIGRAIAELRASQPAGYLNPADYRAAELTKGRIAQGAQAQGRLSGYEVSRRSRARGLAGSPSEERDQARVNAQTALGIQGAGDTAEEQLYNTSLSREEYGRQKDIAIFGAQTQQANLDAAHQDATQAAYWNSLNEFLPTIMSHLPAQAAPAGGGGVTAVPRPQGFVPSGGRGGPTIPAPRY